MEGFPNRKERRLLAKEAGYMKKKNKMNFQAKLELSRKAAEFGKQIHLMNTERMMREEDERIRKSEQNRIDSLVSEGKTYEQAVQILQSENDNNS